MKRPSDDPRKCGWFPDRETGARVDTGAELTGTYLQPVSQSGNQLRAQYSLPGMGPLHIVLLALLLCLALPAWADEDEDTEPAAQEAATEPSSEQAPRSRSDRPFEAFVPSEQISEDAPVPFPVDI